MKYRWWIVIYFGYLFWNSQHWMKINIQCLPWNMNSTRSDPVTRYGSVMWRRVKNCCWNSTSWGTSEGKGNKEKQIRDGWDFRGFGQIVDGGFRTGSFIRGFESGLLSAAWSSVSQDVCPLHKNWISEIIWFNDLNQIQKKRNSSTRKSVLSYKYTDCSLIMEFRKINMLGNLK